jgi:hypothetical protein
MEPTAIPKVPTGEGVGKEELPTQVPWLGIEQVHKVHVLVNNSVLLAWLSCLVLFLRQEEGGEPFGIAAILQTDYEPVFGIWVLPWLVVQVKGVVGAGTSFT